MNIVAGRLWHAVACLSALLEASSTTPRVPSMSLRRPSHESRLNYSLQPAAYFSLHPCPAFPSPSSQVTDDLPRDVSSMRDENSPAIFRLVSLVSHVSNSWGVKEISRAVWVGAANCVLPAYEERRFIRLVRWRDKRDEAFAPGEPAI
jgi:hypothetical protein